MRSLVVQITLLIFIFILSGCAKDKPNMPVKVVSRDSLMGESLVAQFHNESPNKIVIHIVLEDKNKANKHSGQLVLEGNSMKEIGWVEGWKFESGDTIKITHSDYKPIKYYIP